MAGADGQVVFSVEMDDTAFREGMARLEASLTALGQGVVAALTLGAAELSAAYGAGSQWVEGFASGVRAGRGAATAVKAVVSAATAGARATARSGGVSVGQNIVSGIISGASGGSGALNAAIAAIVQSALAAARSEAQIRSPSRLFRDEVGRYLALGLQTGFEETARASLLPTVRQSVSETAAAGRRALEGTLVARVSQAQATPGFSTGLMRVAEAGAKAAAEAPARALAAAAAAPVSDGAVTLNQNITFAAAVQTPDEIARAIRRQTTYGLAGARV